jgi:hypothetical protein
MEGKGRLTQVRFGDRDREAKMDYFGREREEGRGGNV